MYVHPLLGMQDYCWHVEEAEIPVLAVRVNTLCDSECMTCVYTPLFCIQLLTFNLVSEFQKYMANTEVAQR